MARFNQEVFQEAGSNGNNQSVVISKVTPLGYMGEFGRGLWKLFNKNGTFRVPSGVRQVRVRVIGAGGGGYNSGGGAGGGYAHGVFLLNSGSDIEVTVGQGGGRTFTIMNGGDSSFGTMISATGGRGNGFNLPGGIGIGGDFQASGGMSGAGGGGAGSQLGNGGRGGYVRYTYSDTGVAYSGGGGGVLNDGSDFAGGSAFFHATPFAAGPDICGFISTKDAKTNHINAVIRFPFDGFVGGGGGREFSTIDGVIIQKSGSGGTGGGGGSTVSNIAIGGVDHLGGDGGDGGVGGGGGCGSGGVSTTTGQRAALGGRGGIGGGGGMGGLNQSAVGYGGDGLVIVEW